MQNGLLFEAHFSVEKKKENSEKAPAQNSCWRESSAQRTAKDDREGSSLR